MKAVTILCPESGITGSVSSGRVQTHRHRRDVENEEIQMYLSKLKDLVPSMPKDRKLSKVEVIQHVIDYICDLENALEIHPAAVGGFDAAAAAAAALDHHHHHHQQHQQHQQQQQTSPRQPLGVRPSPNRILTTTTSSPTTTTTMNDSMTPHTPEKLSPSDGRPVSSC